MHSVNMYFNVILNKNLKLALFLMMLTLTPLSSFSGSMLLGVSGTLKNVEKAMRAAVLRSEELYEQNGGAYLNSQIELLNGPANPFLNRLTINNNYSIILVFEGDPAMPAFSDDSNAFGSNTTIPVARSLMNKRVMLIPIYNNGDSVITAWECLTDADQVSYFLGANSTATVGNISFLSRPEINQGNVYLSNCIFIDSDSLDPLELPQ